MSTKSFYTKEEINTQIKSGEPMLFHSSCTSTVIPFENLDGQNLKSKLGNLSTMKGELALLPDGNLSVSGFVTWKEAKSFCLSKGREIMTSPTEELAGVLAGIATSCTGERSFGFKNLRSQIVSVNFINHKGEEITLLANKKLECGFDLSAYQAAFSHYKDFKNGPYPRLEYETDLMTGTEGQLGVIVSAVIKTVEHFDETYVFLSLPKWEEDYAPHLEIYKKVQKFRNEIRACELIDSNSLSYLPENERPANGRDLIFLEIKKKDFDAIYENLLSTLELTSDENIFEMNATKCRELRMSVPRAIFEVNTKMGVTKKGTDVQVGENHFKDLLDFYRSFTQKGVAYNLFGHFGDAHLHFNFMPEKAKNDYCNELLESLYKQVYTWQGSPFAEHGIGLLKRKFISSYFTETQKSVFKKLKATYDPKNQFFPEGFMSC